MPKREATPPPGDDEPKYLTICYPYPPHANMELPGDILALARWLACCMKTPDDLYAIFHKPSAPNMVIIEVRREYPGFRQVLGAHKWFEFVKSPGEHSDKITKIYFSTFSTGRAVEKAGWKRIFVKNDWFRGFSPNNKYIAYPYPTSTYCDLPSEDQTGFTLCRPIPRETFFIQIPTPPPRPVPVGSAGWISQRENNTRSIKPRATATAQGAHRAYTALLPELQMPTPSSALKSVVLSLRSSTGHNSGDVYGNKGTLGSSSSSSISYHSQSPVSRPQSGGNTGGSSGYGSESSFQGDYDTPLSSVDDTGGNPYVDGGYFDVPKTEDEFGTLSIHQTTNKDGKPLCPSHGLICKSGICRDYSALLRKIEREKNQASFNKWRGNRGHHGGPGRVETDSNGSSNVNRGRGRGNYRGRGFSPGRGRGSPRGTAFTGGSRW